MVQTQPPEPFRQALDRTENTIANDLAAIPRQAMELLYELVQLVYRRRLGRRIVNFFIDNAVLTKRLLHALLKFGEGQFPVTCLST